MPVWGSNGRDVGWVGWGVEYHRSPEDLEVAGDGDPPVAPSKRPTPRVNAEGPRERPAPRWRRGQRLLETVGGIMFEGRPVRACRAGEVPGERCGAVRVREAHGRHYGCHDDMGQLRWFLIVDFRGPCR